MCDQTAEEHKNLSSCRRLVLCLVMMATESFVGFEEVYTLAILQRVNLPTSLVSLPNTLSSAIGICAVPILGWASDRNTCCTCLGRKRPFAAYSLLAMVTGLSLVLEVNIATLYRPPEGLSPAASQDLNLRSPVLDKEAAKKTGDGRGKKRDKGNQFSSALQNSSSRTVETSETSDQRILAMAGFTLSDHGYDLSISTFRAYMLSVTPPHQQASVLVLSPLMSALGGCVTSAIGYLDLAAMFPEGPGILDRGVARCLVQVVILLLFALIFGSCSLCVGSEVAPLGKTSLNFETEKSAAGKSDMRLPERKTNAEKTRLLSSDKQIYSAMGTANSEEDGAASSSHQSKKASPPPTKTGEGGSTHTPRELPKYLVCFLKRNKQMMSLSLMMFFGITVNYSYLIYVTNYVAQAIYKGDPYGDPGSVDYANYVDGGRMGSLGMLVLYISYFTFTLFHGKVLDKIGMKTEFVVVSAGCGVTLLTLALTDSLVAFFVSSIIMAVYRTIIYTTPFVLANHSLLQQIKDSETDQPKPDNSSAGSAMAWLVTMIPAAYFVISLAMGPLIGVTGSPSPPIFAAGGAAILGLLCLACVDFNPAS
ncbi:hypothetical protein BaRGS_00025722 [Batillaria attramentaria]|uniref:Uncharacterized protein n=1 Tax=Batillaria attramentaria TaxID=370345 RepID=A0ABD0K7B3_9CAEN